MFKVTPTPWSAMKVNIQASNAHFWIVSNFLNIGVFECLRRYFQSILNCANSNRKSGSDLMNNQVNCALTDSSLVRFRRLDIRSHCSHLMLDSEMQVNYALHTLHHMYNLPWMRKMNRILAKRLSIYMHTLSVLFQYQKLCRAASALTIYTPPTKTNPPTPEKRSHLPQFAISLCFWPVMHVATTLRLTYLPLLTWCLTLLIHLDDGDVATATCCWDACIR